MPVAATGSAQRQRRRFTLISQWPRYIVSDLEQAWFLSSFCLRVTKPAPLPSNAPEGHLLWLSSSRQEQQAFARMCKLPWEYEKMSRMHAIIASATVALLVSGTAMAASLQPAAGEAPFLDAAASSSTLTRAAVEAEAAAQLPAAGEMNAVAMRSEAAAQTTYQAVQTGDTPVSGNLPYYAL